MAIVVREIFASFLHTGYFNILQQTDTEEKEKASENQKISEAFVGLINPLVIRLESVFLNALTMIIRDLRLIYFYYSRRYHVSKSMFFRGFPYPTVQSYKHFPKLPNSRRLYLKFLSFLVISAFSGKCPVLGPAFTSISFFGIAWAI